MLNQLHLKRKNETMERTAVGSKLTKPQKQEENFREKKKKKRKKDLLLVIEFCLIKSAIRFEYFIVRLFHWLVIFISKLFKILPELVIKKKTELCVTKNISLSLETDISLIVKEFYHVKFEFFQLF